MMLNTKIIEKGTPFIHFCGKMLGAFLFVIQTSFFQAQVSKTNSVALFVSEDATLHVEESEPTVQKHQEQSVIIYTAENSFVYQSQNILGAAIIADYYDHQKAQKTKKIQNTIKRGKSLARRIIYNKEPERQNKFYFKSARSSAEYSQKLGSTFGVSVSSLQAKSFYVTNAFKIGITNFRQSLVKNVNHSFLEKLRTYKSLSRPPPPHFYNNMVM